MSSMSDAVLVDASAVGEIRNGGRPASFIPGWKPVAVYSGLAPVVVLTLRHENGMEAVWYLDKGLNRQAGAVGELAPELRRALMEAACPLFDSLWLKIMQTAVPPPLDAREAGFFALPEAARQEILGLFLNGFDTTTRFGAVDQLDPKRPDSQLVDLGSRRLPLQRSLLHGLLNPGALQSESIEFLTRGRMSFPSPVDGRPMTVRHALILHGTLYAYRTVDETTGTVLFLLAGEIFFRICGLFIPEARLGVAFQPDHLRAQMPEMYREFFVRIAQHGDLLARYFALEKTEPLHAWRGATAMHIGHVLWNDIAGIANMVRSVPAEDLPRFALFDAQLEPEMYGPLDVIFPELEGRIERSELSMQAAIPSFYRNGQCLIRSSSMHVPKEVRTRILRTVKPLGRTSPASLCMRARASGLPVIMFGLRVENRTIIELERFCIRLVDHLAGSLGRAVLVVDGHNCRIGERDAFIWSHGEHGATRKPIEIELDMIEAMQARAVGTGLEVVSTIGLPITESLACGRTAQVLIAIWGAGLAKYRWVCNIPGLIITNRWNLTNLGDLEIYHSPRMMEEPSPIQVISADAVEDLPDAPLVVRLGEGFIPSICNFSIDETKAMAAVDAVLAAHLLVAA